MADRTLVLYEEPRNPEGPHWTLAVERSAAGRPGGMLTIAEKFEPGAPIRDREMTVVLDDLRRLAPAVEWAEAGSSQLGFRIIPEDLPVLEHLLWQALLPGKHLTLAERLHGEALLAGVRNERDRIAMRDRTPR